MEEGQYYKALGFSNGSIGFHPWPPVIINHRYPYYYSPFYCMQMRRHEYGQNGNGGKMNFQAISYVVMKPKQQQQQQIRGHNMEVLMKPHLVGAAKRMRVVGVLSNINNADQLNVPINQQASDLHQLEGGLVSGISRKRKAPDDLVDGLDLSLKL